MLGVTVITAFPKRSVGFWSNRCVTHLWVQNWIDGWEEMEWQCRLAKRSGLLGCEPLKVILLLASSCFPPASQLRRKFFFFCLVMDLERIQAAITVHCLTQTHIHTFHITLHTYSFTHTQGNTHTQWNTYSQSLTHTNTYRETHAQWNTHSHTGTHTQFVPLLSVVFGNHISRVYNSQKRAWPTYGFLHQFLIQRTTA